LPHVCPISHDPEVRLNTRPAARRFLVAAFVVLAACPAAPLTAKFVPAPGVRDPGFSDDFESYADQAAFERAWSKTGGPACRFDDTFGRDSKKSVKLADPRRAPGGGNGVGNRYYRDLPRPLTPSDDAPVTFSFDLYLDPADAPSHWASAWHTVDLRGYSGDSYGKGDLTGIVSLGVARTSTDPWSASYFQSRVFVAGGDPDIRKQYYTLDAAPNAPRRAPGWHTLSARIGSTSITYLVDGTVAETVNVGVAKPLTTLVIGSDVGSGGIVMSVDNLSVQQSPAPKNPK
jgi:hypothetical protein